MSTKMKTSLVILLYMVLIIGNTAAATSGSIILRGFVPEKADLMILENYKASSVNLGSESGSTLVGTIKENSTKTTGYTVEISSKNATMTSEDTPYLMGDDSNEMIDYNILFGDEVVELDHGVGYVQNPAHTTVSDIAVAYESQEIQEIAQKYSDTLTLSVIAN